MIAPFFALGAAGVAPNSVDELETSVESAYQEVVQAFAAEEEHELPDNAITGVVF